MKPRGAAGFTLLEIIIATLLISTVMSVVLAGFVSANKWVSPESNVAYNLGRERLDRLYEFVRQDWWNNTSTDPQRSLNPAYNPPAETITLDGMAYTRDYTVSALSTKPYRKAKVTVEWG